MKTLDFKKLIASFKAAFGGLRSVYREQTFQLLCFCGFLTIVLMLVLRLSFLEQVIVLLLIASVLAFETINSQIEKILDFLEPNHDPRVGMIKDVSAGAVLLVSVGAAVIGVIIFLPHIIEKIQG